MRNVSAAFLAGVLLALVFAWTPGGDAADGWQTGDDVTATMMAGLETALDAVEAQSAAVVAGSTPAGTATALAANPGDCSANQFATTIAASGALTCAAIADADVPNTITINAATALTANGGNCSSGNFPLGVDTLGAVESCTDAATQTELDAKSAATSTDNAVARYDSTAGDVQNSGVTVDDSNNVDGVGTLDTDGAVTGVSFTSDDSTAEPGNRIQVNDNDTAFTSDPTCANSGVAGTLTLLDSDETASERWDVCDGTSLLFRVSSMATRTESLIIEGITTADDYPFLKAQSALTLTQLDCVATGGASLTTVDVALEECDASGASCVASGATATMTTVDTNVSDSTITDASIDANDWVRVVTGTVTWATPGTVSCTVRYTVQ